MLSVILRGRDGHVEYELPLPECLAMMVEADRVMEGALREDAEAVAIVHETLRQARSGPNRSPARCHAAVSMHLLRDALLARRGGPPEVESQAKKEPCCAPCASGEACDAEKREEADRGS